MNGKHRIYISVRSWALPCLRWKHILCLCLSLPPPTPPHSFTSFFPCWVGCISYSSLQQGWTWAKGVPGFQILEVPPSCKGKKTSVLAHLPPLLFLSPFLARHWPAGRRVTGVWLQRNVNKGRGSWCTVHRQVVCFQFFVLYCGLWVRVSYVVCCHH